MALFTFAALGVSGDADFGESTLQKQDSASLRTVYMSLLSNEI